MIKKRHYHHFYTTILLFMVSSELSATQDSIRALLEETTVKVFQYNCDSIINDIRLDSRVRLLLNKFSVEQIYERKEIYISEEKVDCSGQALLSNSTVVNLSYGRYIDEEGDAIIYYTTEQQ